MTERDPVLERLAELPVSPPSPELSDLVKRRAHAKLLARPVHPMWTLAVAASVILYLGWALHFSRASF